jgi:hypothetical protein
MNREEKSQRYSQLLFEFDRLGNRINSIKGEAIDLNESQNRQIRDLQIQQGKIMAEMQKLMS